MRITEIVVSAGRTVSHPIESYANLKPQLTLKAVLGDDEDPIKAVKALQAQAEQLIEDHARNLSDAIREAHHTQLRTRRVAELEREIRLKQQDLDLERQQLPEARAMQMCLETGEFDNEEQDEAEEQ